MRAVENLKEMLDAAIKEVERECAVRTHVYAKWIAAGRMDEADASKQMKGMLAAKVLLKALHPDNQPDLFGKRPANDLMSAAVSNVTFQLLDQSGKPLCKFTTTEPLCSGDTVTYKMELE
jgi:hypothetical protein